MGSVQIKISIKDYEYAVALAKALSCHYSEFHLKIRNAEENADDWDILLVDGDKKEKCKKMREDPNVLGLCNYWPKKTKEGFIYRYSGVVEISSRILIAYGEKSGKCLKDRPSGKIFGFTGAAGGVGKTVITIAVARELALSYNSNILYISLEEAESTSMYFPNDMGKVNLSDYLYYIFTNKEGSIDLRAFVLSDSYGVDGFRPCWSLNELRELSPDEISVFFNTIINKYEYVLVDFGGHPWEATRLLCSLCTKIILIDDSGPLSLLRNQSLLRFCDSGKGNAFTDKIIAVHNKWTEESHVKDKKNEFFIEKDEESFQIKGNMIEIDIHNRFGMGVKKLAEEIYKKS